MILDAFDKMPDDVFVVLTGTAELWADAERAHDPHGGQVPDLTAGPGDVFGLDATLTGKAIGPLAVAAEAIRVLRVPARRVEAALAGIEPARAASDVPAGPLVLPGTRSLREAARAMNAQGREFTVLELPGGDFIVSPVTAGGWLHAQVRQARTVGELQQRARRMPELLADLLAGGLTSARVLTSYSALIDQVIRRMLELVFEDHPELSPDAFAWLSMGSNGRREATLSSDIDSAAAFPDSATTHEIDAYRTVFFEITAALAEAGLTTDVHGATAAHKLFSRTRADWTASAQQWLAHPLEDNAAMMASLLVDARPIHGDPGLLEVSQVFTSLPRHRRSMRLLLEESLAKRARLRSVRDLLAGHGDRFDIKRHALQPITNLARWAAMSAGSPALPTTDRLRAAAGSAMLPERQAAALIEVYEVLQAIRLRHQLRQVEAGLPASDDLELSRLSAIDGSIITRAVREIAAVQKRMVNLSRYTEIEEWNRPEPPTGRPR
ncbi:MAG: hypothetical protein KBG85_09085 [Micropruina sp.]|nr:hypothetical protein [Micropruina sp.]